MQTAFNIAERAKANFMGTRHAARELRQELEKLLAHTQEVVLDFSGMISATQSFVDELVGVLILDHGPEVTNRLIFKGCSDDIKALLRFVVTTRTEDHQKKSRH